MALQLYPTFDWLEIAELGHPNWESGDLRMVDSSEYIFVIL
jgi:hypothetical protein